MPRLTPRNTRELVPEVDRSVFDEICSARGGAVSEPTGCAMYSPQTALHASRLVDYLRYDSTLKPAEAELAILTSARATNTDYIWAAHTHSGLAAGVRPEAIAIIDERGALDSLTPDEALIVRYGRELMEADSVSDATFDAVRHRFGERGLIELTSLMARYVHTAYIIKAVALQPAADGPRLSRELSRSG